MDLKYVPGKKNKKISLDVRWHHTSFLAIYVTSSLYYFIWTCLYVVPVCTYVFSWCSLWQISTVNGVHGLSAQLVFSSSAVSPSPWHSWMKWRPGLVQEAWYTTKKNLVIGNFHCLNPKNSGRDGGTHIDLTHPSPSGGAQSTSPEGLVFNKPSLIFNWPQVNRGYRLDEMRPNLFSCLGRTSPQLWRRVLHRVRSRASYSIVIVTKFCRRGGGGV
jgi:hypothetical protein